MNSSSFVSIVLFCFPSLSFFSSLVLLRKIFPDNNELSAFVF